MTCQTDCQGLSGGGAAVAVAAGAGGDVVCLPGVGLAGNEDVGLDDLCLRGQDLLPSRIGRGLVPGRRFGGFRLRRAHGGCEGAYHDGGQKQRQDSLFHMCPSR